MSTPMPRADTIAAQAARAMRHSWFPVARSVDVTDVPVPAVLLGEKLAVFRGTDGLARVTANRCPHRGGSLGHGTVHGNNIACPYHGWQFSGESGACALVPSLPDQAKIPPRAAITTYPAQEQFGHIWTCLAEPEAPMYAPARWAGLELEWLAATPIPSDTGVAVAIENFRDVAHFPFVHQVSMGPTPPIVEPLQVRREGLDVYLDRPLDAGEGDWASQGDCTMHYQCTAPGFASITYDYADLGQRIVAGFPSPVAYDQVVIFWAVANEVGFRGDDLQECLRVEEMVYLEDIPIVGELDPREVPWDREVEEFSVPADLFTLSYRRSFRELMERVSARYAPEPVLANSGA
ncbi:aromatic ring-hydroxylating dioxygenase subunit alpha [Jatrophihabitans telluris]|uniref:Aromatic ring-hydroxylating dioxygenase subunit alpha n=1 Tax=Jatrophihabitans telluris TaxID=2038343 RepID=A0ABY4R0B1_9ACTN|nr:aromatic ring-hydroxylating dioxygenase subunit alpha [Jatrophihabitans telluris]UQX89210.1 aromatic ring-hydroxylating dioxygenase subunit alpha [Jatrophihabitans telluris]